MEIRPHRVINRKKTKKIKVGNITVGGDSQISVQSMTNTLTTDVKETIKQINKTEDICAAPERLFIPNQTLKTPRVKVSKAKYSTVPKSEIVSINTRANPANIPGLASGRATEKKLLRPYIKLV